MTPARAHLKASAETITKLVVEMADYAGRYLATLPPEQAEARLRAAEQAAAEAKSSAIRPIH